MTPDEAINLLREHAIWRGEIWALTPEGRAYASRFNEAISALDRDQRIDRLYAAMMAAE